MIGRPMPYMAYLMSCATRYEVNSGSETLMPMWIVNEWRTFRWMEELYRSMEFFLIGYTVSKQLRFRIAHAPDIRCKSFKNMSGELHRILDQFCGILQNLNDEVFGHFDNTGTVILMNREDREKWDAAQEKIYDLLYSPGPDRGIEPPCDVDTTLLVSCPYGRI